MPVFTIAPGTVATLTAVSQSVSIVPSLAPGATYAPNHGWDPAVILPANTTDNCKGRSMCYIPLKSRATDTSCSDAGQAFQDAAAYTERKSRMGANQPNCTAIYVCNNAYPLRSGTEIKAMVRDGVWGATKQNCGMCGSWYLNDINDCHVAVNACADCKNTGS